MGMPATSVQLQPFPRLRRGEYPRPHGFDDGARLPDQLRVARIHAAAQIQVVFQSHAHVAPEEYRLRDPRHLHAAHRERGPQAILGQVVPHGQQVADVRGHAVRDAGAQLDHRRSRDQAFLEHLLHEPEVTGIKYFQLHLHAQLAQDAGTLAAVIGRGNVGAVAIAEVERAAIERGDVRTVQPLAAQVDDVPHALFLADEVGARRGRVRKPPVADTDITPHAAVQGDGDVHTAPAAAPYRSAVEAG